MTADPDDDAEEEEKAPTRKPWSPSGKANIPYEARQEEWNGEGQIRLARSEVVENRYKKYPGEQQRPQRLLSPEIERQSREQNIHLHFDGEAPHGIDDEVA